MATQKLQIPIEKIVADHLENSMLSLHDALEELGLDIALAENTDFCRALDQHIFYCTDCGYWYLLCLMVENEKSEEICEDCAENS